MSPPTQPQLTSQQQHAIVAQWFATNQAAIDQAVLAALDRVDGLSEALTDPDSTGLEAVRQKVEGLITAARAVLPAYMGESFELAFATSSAGLRETLRAQSESICFENLDFYIDALLRRSGLLN